MNAILHGMRNNQSSPTLLVEMKNVVTTLENCLAVLYNVEHTLTL